MKKCGGMLGCVAVILLIIGGLNWGLVGLFGLNLVNVLLGSLPIAERIVYIIVGLAAIYKIFICLKCCKKCGNQKCG